MAVGTTDNRIQYNGDDSTTGFAVPILFQVNTWIKAILTDSTGSDTALTEGVDYTLIGATVATGGTLTMIVAPATGERLTIYREAPYNQLTTYEYSGSFPADANENTVDKITILAQQNLEIAQNLAITYPQSEPSSTDSTLPDLATRKGKYLFFDATTGNVSTALASSVATTLLDEDDMVSDDDTVGATQQSIKAYVDNEVAAVGAGDTVAPATHGASLIPQWNGTPNSKTLVAGLTLDTDTALAADSDTTIATQKAVKAYAMNFSDDVLDEDDMVSNSDTKAATQQSVKAYVDAQAGGTTPDDYISTKGLLLSKSTTTTIDITAGQAMDTTNALFMDGTAFNKDLNGTWVVGTTNAGLDTGAIAIDTWYHVYLIAKTDGTIDYIYSTNATTPDMTLPNAGGFTLFRYVGSVLTDSTPEIIPFYHLGNETHWSNPISDFGGTIATSPTLKTMTTPLGLETVAMINFRIDNIVTTNFHAYSAKSSDSPVPTSILYAGARNSTMSNILTDTSSQIKVFCGNSGVQASGNSTGWKYER